MVCDLQSLVGRLVTPQKPGAFPDFDREAVIVGTCSGDNERTVSLLIETAGGRLHWVNLLQDILMVPKT
jgi:hypothetical protein